MRKELIDGPSVRTQVLKFAEERRLGDAEDAWIDLLDDPPEDPDFYRRTAKCFIKGRAADKGLELILLLLEGLKDRSRSRPIERIIYSIAPHWPDSSELRRLAEPAMRACHDSHPELNAMIRACQIAGNVPLDGAMKKFRLLLRLSPGYVYQHDSWGEGVVRSLDLLTEKVVLDFPTEKGKTLTLEGVRRFLTFIEPSNFLAQRATSLEKLRTMADEDPVSLVKSALLSAGGNLQQSEMKTLIGGRIVPMKSWTSWWARARRELRLDPFIELDATGGARARISLRDIARSVLEEVDQLFFDDDASMATRVAAVGRLAENRNRDAAHDELCRRMLSALSDESKTQGDEDRARRLEIAYLCQSIEELTQESKPGRPGAPSVEAVLATVTAYDVLLDIEHPEYAVQAFTHLVKRDGDEGAAQGADLLPRAEINLAQAIWRSLDAEHHHERATDAINRLVEEPLDRPDTYFWAVKAIVGGEWDHLEGYFSLATTVRDLLNGLGTWQDTLEDPHENKQTKAQAKRLIGKVRNLLFARHCSAICRAVESMTLEQAQRLRALVRSNRTLSITLRASADRQLVLTRKDLESGAGEPPEQDFLYCTARARLEKARELQELTAVKIPANSKAILEARKEGDLKENAGYHAAKDEQKILMQKALQLREAMSVAREMEASMISTHVIGFGTTFEAENCESGVRESYTVLGPWETEPDRNILSIHAPFAQQFLDHKVGDEQEISHPGGGSTIYRILSISNALATGEWDAPEG